jgi:hypothetical protein
LSNEGLKDLGYLGKCYDVVTLDPLDMGGSAKETNALRLTVGSEDDGKLPAGVTVNSVYNTDATASKSVLFNSYDFIKEFSSSMSVNAGLPGMFELSGSVSAKEFTQASGSRKQAFAYATIRVQNHKVAVDLDQVSPTCLDRSFAAGVGTLPAEWATKEQKAAYTKFIQKFGTHFTRKVSLGGFAYSRVSKEETQIGAKTESESEFTAKASLEVAGFESGASLANTRKEISQRDQTNKIHRESIVFRGGIGTSHEIKDDWSSGLDERPAPISLDAELQRLSVLLTAYFFEGDAAIDQKRNALDQAINDYLVSKGQLFDGRMHDGDDLSLQQPHPSLGIERVLFWTHEAPLGKDKQLFFKNPALALKPGQVQPTIKLKLVNQPEDGLLMTGQPVTIWVEVPGGPKGYLTLTDSTDDTDYLVTLAPDSSALNSHWKAVFMGGGDIATPATTPRPLVSGDRMLFVCCKTLPNGQFATLGRPGRISGPSDYLVAGGTGFDPRYSGSYGQDISRLTMTVRKTATRAIGTGA